MTYSEKLLKAKTTLGLTERATLKEIKAKYYKLMKLWHPDTVGDDEKDKATKMSYLINESYEIILNYCNEYEFDFSESEINRHLPVDEWWRNKFGQ